MADASPAPVPASAPTPSPPLAEAAKGPNYRYQLSNGELQRDREEMLSIAVAQTLSPEDLDVLLAGHQKSARAALAATPSAANDAHPTRSGDHLESPDWSTFKFLRARITCEDTLRCIADDAPRPINNEVMIWDFTIAAAKWDESRQSSIQVRFFGDASATGPFAEEVAALPPLLLEVRVSKDLAWWTTSINALAQLLSATKGMLAAAGGLVALVLGWCGWRWRRRGRSSASPPSA
jgi:hypothetical protein